jgi:ABC-type transporter Mla subunit MlaD
MLRNLIQWLLHDPRFTEILRVLYTIVQGLQEMSDTLSAEIQQLVQNVQRMTSVTASAEATLRGLHDQLDAALANAHERGVDPEALQQLHDLSSQIAAQTSALSAAIAANTPGDTAGGATGATGDTGATGGNGGDTGDTGATAQPGPTG